MKGNTVHIPRTTELGSQPGFDLMVLIWLGEIAWLAGAASD